MAYSIKGKSSPSSVTVSEFSPVSSKLEGIYYGCQLSSSDAKEFTEFNVTSIGEFYPEMKGTTFRGDGLVFISNY